jgi:rubrerythrin
MYKEFSDIAKKEGYDAIAKLFSGVGEIEKFHQSRYDKFLKDINDKTVYEDTKEVYWWCMNCGTFVKGKTPPDKCPVCFHPKAYFVRKTITITE